MSLRDVLEPESFAFGGHSTLSRSLKLSEMNYLR